MAVFQELARLQYRDAVFLPIWESGFAPDRYDRHAPYLGKGITYILINTGRVEVGGIAYEVWEGGGKGILRPAQPST